MASEQLKSPVFLNDSVIQQLDNEQDMIGSISRILIIYTGGTIGMQNTPEKGYLPVPGHLSKMLSTMTTFHDPMGFAQETAKEQGPGSPTDKETLFPLTNTVNITLEYPSGIEEDASPMSRTGSSTQTPGVVTRLPNLQNISLAGSPTKATASNATQTINGTPVMRSRKAALITPSSLYGKRIRYSILEYDPLLDSSNMNMTDWIKIATDIEVNYKLFDAFIILHGTDTMAYTASALSFLLENLGKTVIITGSQVPLAEVRNDAVDNLLGALTIAGHFVIPEVGLYFDNKLFRGNRSSKINAVDFNAFDSPNLRPLVKMGINIDVSWADVWRPTEIAKFKAHKTMNPAVATLRLFPGITESTIRAFLSVSIAGVVLETYGSGNAPNNRPELLALLRDASDRGVVIINCTQCKRGLVTDLYATGRALTECGVVPGADMTPEAALTKLSYLLSKYKSPQVVRQYMRKSICGELTVPVRRQRFTYVESHNLATTILSLLGKEAPEQERGKLDSDRGDKSGSLERSLVPMVLCQAARVGDVSSIQAMAHVYPHLVNAVDYDGRSPLHVAASEGHVDTIKALLCLGAHVHARDKFGHSPLRDALTQGHEVAIGLLTLAGAHITELEYEDVVYEAIKWAATGDVRRLELCMSAGMDLNAPWIDGQTVLHTAARMNQIPVVEFLVKLSDTSLQNPHNRKLSTVHAPLNLHVKDKQGRTPRDIALQNGPDGSLVVDMLGHPE